MPDAGTRAPAAGTTLELLSEGPADTRALAAALATTAEPGDMICLWGELGAGKTVFAKGFGAGLGVEATILSPSFVLMAEYAGRLPLFHIDLYRLSGAREVVDGGLLDERQGSGVVLIEWPDRLDGALPDDRLDVRIDGAADEPRRLTLEGHGGVGDRYLATARAVAARVMAPPPGPADAVAGRP